MNLGTVIKISFAVSFILTLVGAYYKISHLESAESLLIAGVISSLIFMVSAIYEIRTSNRISKDEKIKWTALFIFFGAIAGLVYIFNARKKIANIDTTTNPY